MIEEFKAFFTLFQQGKEIANAKAWKDKQHAGNALLSVLGAAVVIAGGFGYHVEIDHETLQAASAGIVAVVGIVNQVLTVITSKRVGIKTDTDE